MGQFYQISSINEWINTTWMELLTEWMSNHKQIVWVSIILKKILEKWKELENSPIHFILQKFLKIDTQPHLSTPTQFACNYSSILLTIPSNWC